MRIFLKTLENITLQLMKHNMLYKLGSYILEKVCLKQNTGDNYPLYSQDIASTNRCVEIYIKRLLGIPFQ